MSNKTRPQTGESEFLQAALAFDNELGSFERAMEGAQRGALNSGKNLERAAQSLKQVTDAEDRLRAASQALSGAIRRGHEQQVAQMQKLGERAELIAARTAQFQELTEGYRTLGAAAAALNGVLGEIARKKKELGDKLSGAAFVAELTEMQGQMSALAEKAKELLEAARAADFDDIVRQVDSVRQQLLSARNKLSLFSRP